MLAVPSQQVRLPDDATLPPLPQRVQLEVTDRCHLGCTSSARPQWDILVGSGQTLTRLWLIGPELAERLQVPVSTSLPSRPVPPPGPQPLRTLGAVLFLGPGRAQGRELAPSDPRGRNCAQHVPRNRSGRGAAPESERPDHPVNTLK